MSLEVCYATNIWAVVLHADMPGNVEQYTKLFTVAVAVVTEMPVFRQDELRYEIATRLDSILRLLDFATCGMNHA